MSVPDNAPCAIAIDGPAAAGKSTVGRLLAQRLGRAFIDTGDMYRALTWLALESGIAPDDAAALTSLARSVRITLEPFIPDGSRQSRLLIDGRDAMPHLRTPQVDASVSLVSRVSGVRGALVEEQRRLARGQAIVMAGRDIGSVVLPDACVKVYLDASPAERARRRFRQNIESGEEERRSIAQVQAEIEQRDRTDQERADSPLKPAADAVIINTDDLSPEEVTERILRLLR